MDNGDAVDAGDFPPPPPPLSEDPGNPPPLPGAFPPPPPPDQAFFNVEVNPGAKTLEERRSSLDAEIDSLTSILADLENSSPYKPRTPQVRARSCVLVARVTVSDPCVYCTAEQASEPQPCSGCQVLH
ncbi:lipoma-preferred partner homolog [Sphaerodactylus townsendi]|uniref:lipoma-preferred partner homolog n=1 Tax=Sphaerodactylus townsendi TaxID=933632 RepID=UPI0020271FAB|nr:lipoma-preferred partner homolog [Sphaerodactylus townsendi]